MVSIFMVTHSDTWSCLTSCRPWGKLFSLGLSSVVVGLQSSALLPIHARQRQHWWIMRKIFSWIRTKTENGWKSKVRNFNWSHVICRSFVRLHWVLSCLRAFKDASLHAPPLSLHKFICITLESELVLLQFEIPLYHINCINMFSARGWILLAW